MKNEGMKKYLGLHLEESNDVFLPSFIFITTSFIPSCLHSFIFITTSNHSDN